MSEEKELLVCWNLWGDLRNYRGRKLLQRSSQQQPIHRGVDKGREMGCCWSRRVYSQSRVAGPGSRLIC